MLRLRSLLIPTHTSFFLPSAQVVLHCRRLPLPQPVSRILALHKRASHTMASSAASGSRTYAEAIEALNTLQSNAATIAAIRASGGKANDLAISEMVEYLSRIGYSLDDLDRLNIIHITGTKGKGSTAAFCSQLVCDALSEKGGADAAGPKVGLYTSPHMLLVRERVRLDGLPLSEERFAKDFWYVWDKLGETADERARPDVTPVRPVYFRFMTLLSFHTFLTTPSLRAVILEVGIGGKYDSTNIVKTPVVCGVATLGLDHTALLGNTIEEIAEQKAGIYKKGRPALAVRQSKETAEAVLRRCAEEIKAPFTLLPAPSAALQKISLGLPGPHQVTNAHLALSLVESFLENTSDSSTTPTSVWSDKDTLQPAEWAQKSLRNARWPGRCQIVRPALVEPSSSSSSSGEIQPTYFLDGAHTTDSLALCTKWFIGASESVAAEHQPCSSDSSSQQVERHLIFNCTNGRSAAELLSSLLSTISAETSNNSDSSDSPTSYFTQVHFCTNVTYSSRGFSSDLTSKALDPDDLSALSIQRELKAAWLELAASGSGAKTVEDEEKRVQIWPTIEDAIKAVASSQSQPQAQTRTQAHVLVAGSLHLVGGVMSHLKDAGALDEKLEAVWGNVKV